ncbi:MAG TPA: hypothetical protein VJR92_03845 [Gemmatimonadaceae bacterium]|nr:hypothetical protein [Gemmatimonadaceae bacterium]
MLFGAVVAAALALQSGGPQARGAPLERALLDSLESASLRFFNEWGLAWRTSEAERHQFEFNEAGMRTRHLQLHCHPDVDGPYARLRMGSMIRSDDSWYAVCPTWFLGDVGPADERLGLDNALASDLRTSVRARRQSLIDYFARASAALPTSAWIVGQRVRFLVDQRSLDSAQRVARECRADAWWCAQLSGYVLAARGDWLAAESVFVAAVEQMPAAERCRRTDLSDLLDSAGRDAYAKIPCAERAAMNERIWWLADPLYMEAGNERRAEQFVRQVLVEFRRSITRDERYNWNRGAGGDALMRMIDRYGWPAYTFWNGLRTDLSHSAYLVGNGTGMNEPYSTFEYGASRVHLFPAWDAVADPLRSHAVHWTISDTTRADQWSESLWWPREHAALKAPLVQLPEPQVAFLRRDAHVIVAAATDLAAGPLGRAQSAVVEGTLMLSDAPGAFENIGHGAGIVGEPLVVRGTMRPRPTLMGIEFMAPRPSGPPGGRTRQSIAPPATLAALPPNGLAISEPVVLRAPPDDGALSNTPDSALARMAGSTRVPASKRIGVYWETYGFRPGDSVNVAIWIERFTQQGVMRRFGIALRVATDLNTPIAMSWSEPDPGRRSHVISGDVPIVGRSVVLDVSTLPRGEYWLDVAVGKPGQEPVRGRRAFTVR